MENQPFTVESVIGESPIPSEVKLNKEWGEQFGHNAGVTFRLPHGNLASLFLDKRLGSNDPREVLQVLGHESIGGYVVSCESQEWVVNIEPTAEGKFGLIVYTKTGKAYIAGEGSVEKSGKWQAKFSTLYPGIRNKKRCKVQGGIRGGTGQRTEVQIGVSCG